MTPSDPFVARVRDCGLRYGRKIALDGVSLAIPAGKRIALIGPDGVRKSSLLLPPELEKQIADGTLKLAGNRSIEELERERDIMLMEWRRDNTVDPDVRAVVRSYE
jgi:ribosome-dependent ATPase